MTIVSTQELMKQRGLSEEAAIKWNNDKRNAALDNRMGGKSGDRPWGIIDMNKLLPKDQVWIGFEYETGFDDLGQYRAAIAYLWDNFNYLAIDREGSGQYPFEVAFGPVTYDTICVKKEAPIQKYLKWLAEQGYKQSNEPTTFSRTLIGMHVNISTPKSRGRYNDDTGYRIRKLLDALPQRVQEELFGRYQNRFSKCYARGNYFEFKLFGSTDSVEKFDSYVKVAGKLAGLIDFCIDNPGTDPTNVYEYLSGKDEKLNYIPDSSAKIKEDKPNVRARRQ